MYRKTTLMAAMLMLCLCAAAQRKVGANPWVQPQPTASTLSVGTDCYLFNTGEYAFYTGGNDWNTRASFNATHGYKVHFERYLNADESWDEQSYLLKNNVEDGNLSGQIGDLKILNYNDVYVDEGPEETDDKGIRLVAQSDGSYYIGLSPKNKEYNSEDRYLAAGSKQVNDTRLYFIDCYDDPEASFNWIIVLPAEYETYLSEVKRYEAAMQLYAALLDAESYASITTTAEEAVFQNTSSTTAELNAAFLQLTEKMVNAADCDHPADVTHLITNPDYANHNNDGWVGSNPGFQSCPGAEFYWTNYDANQTISGLKEGFYAVTLDAYYRAGWPDNDAAEWEKLQNGEKASQNAKVYTLTTSSGTTVDLLPLAHDGVSSEKVGNDNSETAYGYIPNNMYSASLFFAGNLYSHPAVALAYVADGNLTIGVKKETVLDGDWTYLYQWQLYYLGTGDDAAVKLRDQHLAAYPDYYSKIATSEVEFYNRDLYTSYAAAYTAMKDATTKDLVLAAIPTFNEQAALFQQNVEAYDAYYAAYEDAENFVTEHQADLMGDGMDALAEYVWDEIAPSSECMHPNGTAQYILENGTLTTAEVLAEIEYVKKLKDDALAGGMTDGMDVTDLIKNPHFAEEGVWAKEGLPEWPLGPDGYKLAQAYTIVFGVSQELTGLQNGLYELSLNDLYRPANYGAAEYGNEPRCYVNMNGFQKNFNTIESGAIDEAQDGHTYYIEGAGYVPNTVEEAATSFQAGHYRQTLYGLVTDGTMTISLSNKLRYEGCWAVFSDLRLTFRAKNPEVLAEVIEMTLPEASDLMSSVCGTEELGNLSDKRAKAESAEGEGRYDAMVALKEAMDAVRACTETYVQLNTAIASLQQAIDEKPEASKIDDAKALLAEASNGYANGSYNNEAAQAKIAEIGEMIVAVRIGESAEEEQDFSDLIVNRNFDPTKGSKDTQTIEGWTTSAMNGYKEYTVSYNRAGIDLYQTINGLPKGKYKVTVHSYYRAGYWDEEETRVNNGEETHLSTLYAQTPDKRFETKVMNLYEGASSDNYGVNCYVLGSGLYAPNGTTPTAEFFKQGHYLNELEFTVKDDNSSVTIGLLKTEVLANDYSVVGEWNLYYYGVEEDVREDYSSLIVNNTFDPAKGSKDTQTIEGWTTSAMNGYKEYTVSYNRAGIDLYQDITVPKGNYELTVHSYYRAGYWDEEETRVNNGEETHLTTLYANVTDGERYETKVMNLYEDASSDNYGVNCYVLGSGLYAPNGTTPTAKFFAEGHYLNKLYFRAPTDNCKVRIGLSKTEVLANDYQVVGEWNLYYLGNSTGIEDAVVEKASTAQPAEFFTLSGVRIDRPQRGINVVRMSDGSVRKVLVK